MGTRGKIKGDIILNYVCALTSVPTGSDGRLASPPGPGLSCMLTL